LKKFTLLLCILLTIALLFSCTVHIFFYLQSQRVEEETRQTFREYNRQKDAYQQSIYDLEQTIQQLKSEMADMEKLIDLFDKKDELYAEMNNRLRDHQQKLAEAEIEIARLNADLEKLTVVCNIDMNAQRLLLDELENLLKNPPQKSTQVPIEPESETVTSSGGTAESTAETEPVYQTVLSDASISLYYRDLENGFTYSYNADAVYDSASLIKLPLALSLLQPTDGTDYDFSEIFTFDPEEIDETITEGSGEIKKIKEKTDFTYLQLFEYMIRYSDNVAFSAIKDKYSYTPLRNWCSVKGKGMIPANRRVPGAAVFWGSSASNIHHVAYLWKPVKAGHPEGDWYLIEARGVMYGVVKTKLLTRKPNYWGYMDRYFDYSENVSVEDVADIVETETLGSRELKNGTEGNDVKELQSSLISLGYDLGRWGADGDFGDQTEIAVKHFQRDYGLDATGVFNAKCLKELEEALVALAKPTENPKKVLIEGGDCYIRFDPSLTGKIVGVAKLGEEYAYGGEIAQNGWVKIVFKSTTAWVSGKYAKLK